VEDGKQL